MLEPTYLALIVDDEALVRQATMRALAREGFRCEAAADGVQAFDMLDSERHDVVVTDLKMPNQNGFSLALEILAVTDHPAVIVLTGVVEVRLAKDLLARGVEDIVYKPVDYQLFAAKVKAIAERRRQKLAAKQAAKQKV